MEKLNVLAHEFLARPESNTFCELVDGEIIMAPSPEISHQRTAFRFAQVIVGLIPDGEVMIAPLDVKFDEANVLQPDVFWVSGHNPACVPVDGKYWHGAPDLIIEVLSPSTARQDKVTKFQLYEKHGVREYWIVDPNEPSVEVWQLVEKQFQRLGNFQGEFTSPLLGTVEGIW